MLFRSARMFSDKKADQKIKEANKSVFVKKIINEWKMNLFKKEGIRSVLGKKGVSALEPQMEMPGVKSGGERKYL